LPKGEAGKVLAAMGSSAAGEVLAVLFAAHPAAAAEALSAMPSVDAANALGCLSPRVRRSVLDKASRTLTPLDAVFTLFSHCFHAIFTPFERGLDGIVAVF